MRVFVGRLFGGIFDCGPDAEEPDGDGFSGAALATIHILGSVTLTICWNGHLTVNEQVIRQT